MAISSVISSPPLQLELRSHWERLCHQQSRSLQLLTLNQLFDVKRTSLDWVPSPFRWWTTIVHVNCEEVDQSERFPWLTKIISSQRYRTAPTSGAGQPRTTQRPSRSRWWRASIQIKSRWNSLIQRMQEEKRREVIIITFLFCKNKQTNKQTNKHEDCGRGGGGGKNGYVENRLFVAFVSWYAAAGVKRRARNST